MRICGKCRAAAPDGVCPLCGKQKTIREAKPDESVYLADCDYIWSRVLEDALSDAGIAFFRHGMLGSGVTVNIGVMAERFRYYVNASDYEKAKEILPPDAGDVSDEELESYIDSYEKKTDTTAEGDETK